jgi:8-oxo-dGTP diphosphatase
MTPIDKLAWILVRDRTVLYARSHDKDLFYNPGGKREGMESDQEALIREIKEELGVDLVPASIAYLETFTAQAAGKPQGVQVQIKCFKADYVGTLAPANEVEEIDWFTSTDMQRTSLTGQLILRYLKESDEID